MSVSPLQASIKADRSKKLAAARSSKLAALSKQQISQTQISQKQLGGGSRKSIDSGNSLQLKDANVDSGMVLPFEPMIMTFKDVHYYVPLPGVSRRSVPPTTVSLSDTSPWGKKHVPYRGTCAVRCHESIQAFPAAQSCMSESQYMYSNAHMHVSHVICFKVPGPGHAMTWLLSV